MNYFNKIFAHCKPAAKHEHQEIDEAVIDLANAMNELHDAKAELKCTQEKIKGAQKVARITVKTAKEQARRIKSEAAEWSIKHANDEIARNKEIDDKIKACRRIEQADYYRKLTLLRERVVNEEIRAISEIKAIHQAIKDSALSRP